MIWYIQNYHFSMLQAIVALKLALVALKLAQSVKTDDNKFCLHERKLATYYLPKKTNTFGFASEKTKNSCVPTTKHVTWLLFKEISMDCLTWLTICHDLYCFASRESIKIWFVKAVSSDWWFHKALHLHPCIIKPLIWSYQIFLIEVYL